MKTATRRVTPNQRRDDGLAARAKDAAEKLNEAIAACGRVGLQTEIKVWGKKGDIPMIDVFVARPL